MQWREIGPERSLVGEVGVIAEELQAAGGEDGESSLPSHYCAQHATLEIKIGQLLYFAKE
jgi:hypothetical protein